MPFTSILNRLENAIPYADKVYEKVSQRGVDWHLEHSLKIVNSICKTLVGSKEEDYAPKFSLPKYYILWTNKIPRGKARSPKIFNTKETVDTSTFPEFLEKTKQRLVSIENLKAQQHFRHPLFGDLKLKAAKKFINIHTSHHLDIIEEIIAAS